MLFPPPHRDPAVRARRELAFGMARAALEAVDAHWCTRQALARLREDGVPLDGCVVYAFGKASESMARAALAEVRVRRGLVHTTRDGRLGPMTLVKSGHPVPLDDAAERGAAMLADAEQLGDGDIALCLISGGGSSMLEAPREGISMADITERTAAALRDGVDIQELNRRRAEWSRVKAGGLARAIAPARVINVVISDVPFGGPEWVASGPTIASDIDHITRVAADNSTAVQAAAHHALRHGKLVHTWPEPIAGDAAALGERVQTIPSAFVAGGETTVRVTGDGVGGRNQHLIIGAMHAFRGGLTLSLATDGVDGPTSAAGGFVDAETLRVVAQQRVRDALLNQDSHTLLSQLGATLRTGPTGTNVADLLIRLT